MAIAYVSGSAANAGSGTSVAVPAPAGIVAGNLLVMIGYTANGETADVINVPAGWTRAGSPMPGVYLVGAAGVFVKVATGGEPASYTVTGTAYLSAAILQYSGSAGLAGDPVYNAGTTGNPQPATGTRPVTAAGSVAVAGFGSYGGNAWSTPNGMTARPFTQASTSTSLYTFDATVAPTTAGPYTSTQASTGHAEVLFVVAPAAGGTPPPAPAYNASQFLPFF